MSLNFQLFLSSIYRFLVFVHSVVDIEVFCSAVLHVRSVARLGHPHVPVPRPPPPVPQLPHRQVSSPHQPPPTQSANRTDGDFLFAHLNKELLFCIFRKTYETILTVTAAIR